jgi:hypothetical protein
MLNSLRSLALARSQRREHALKRGADDLMALVEWCLRDKPRALRRARRRYVKLCERLYKLIARARPS